jgi:hypothetical protein
MLTMLRFLLYSSLVSYLINKEEHCGKLIGSKVRLYSFKLNTNGLYVSIKEAAASILSNASHVKGYRDVIELLFTFKVCMEKINL